MLISHCFSRHPRSLIQTVVVNRRSSIFSFLSTAPFSSHLLSGLPIVHQYHQQAISTMPARKASASAKLKDAADTEAPTYLMPSGSGPSRRSARQANNKWDADYAGISTTPLKAPIDSESEENESEADVTDLPYRANMSAKRSAPGSNSGSAKRVKFEKREDGGVKTEAVDTESGIGLLSPEETESDASDGSEEDDEDFEDAKPAKKIASKRASKKVKSEDESDLDSPSTPKGKSSSKSKTSTQSPHDKAAQLQAKKLKSYSQFLKQSPFPDFPHPTPDEARLAHRILAKIHGERLRPEKVVARSDRAGCGDSPSVLDALVRTILSQNTSDKNSTRAKLSMDKVYGGSDRWEDIVKGGQAKLQESIKSGGLSAVKSKVIISILEQVKQTYGKYSLDHLFEKSDEEAMHELISFQGVGPKTASCVLLFCLQRESFAVDTHVYRIAGLLGWRPASASRDETHAHLEVKIPDEEKYGLHILMVGHGKKCEECKAGGRSIGKCELRKAFRQKKLKGEAGEELQEEEEENVKSEGGDVEKVKKEEDIENGQEDYVHGMQIGKGKGKKKAIKGAK